MESKSCKNILFISPTFFSYTQLVINELEKRGYQLDVFPIEPKLSKARFFFFLKDKRMRSRLMDNYARHLLKLTENKKYDFLFFNTAIWFSPEEIQLLSSFHQEAKTIGYFWDTLSNFPQAATLVRCFDKCFSFDKGDCLKYSLLYRPTFFDPSILTGDGCGPSSDIVFVGSGSAQRFAFIEKFKNEAEKQGLKCDFRIYFPSKSFYTFQKITHEEFRHTSAKDFCYKKVARVETNRILCNAKAVIDFPFGGQNGLTMRAIETAVLGKRYIVPSFNESYLELFDRSDILVFDPLHPAIPSSFFADSCNRAKKDFSHFTVQSFVDDIFFGE